MFAIFPTGTTEIINPTVFLISASSRGVKLKAELVSIGFSVTKGEESKSSCNPLTYFLSQVSLQQVGSVFIGWLCNEQHMSDINQCLLTLLLEERLSKRVFQEIELSPSHLLEKVGQFEHLMYAGAGAPLQPMMWTVVRHCAPGTHCSRGCPKEAETLREASAGAGSWQDVGHVERGACSGAALLAGLVNLQVTHAGAVSS